MRGSQRSLLVVATMIVALVAPVALQAAPILYPDSPVIPPGVAFTNIFESSGTDPVPLYGPPAYFTTGMDFDPTSFVASATNGAIDVTDGQLDFTVGDAPGGSFIAINSISLAEFGDYSLTGTGTSATQALAGAILRVTVTEINGVPVAPIVLLPSNASVGFNLVANPGLVQPWSLGATINVDGQLGANQDATRVEVTINNQMQALSQSASAAFIAKKDFSITVNAFTTNLVPEPGSVSLLAVGVLGMLARRRRR